MRFLAVDCPDCITNVDLTDKNSIIACANSSSWRDYSLH